MLKRLSPREVLENLAHEWEATLAREWLDAIRSITSAVVLLRLIFLAALDLALYRHSDEARAVLAFHQHSIDPRQGPLWEPRRGLLVIDLLPAHAAGSS
jgi:hypothetical protein